MATFKVGDIVQVGSQGEKGKIIDVIKPLGTYSMYKVHLMTTGNVRTAALHELVKGMLDQDFQDLFDCFDTEHSNDPIVVNVPSRAPASSSIPKPIEEYATFEQRPNSQQNDDIAFNSEDVLTARPLFPNEQANTSKRFATLKFTPRQFVIDNENTSTRWKTISHIKLLQEFLSSKHETRETHLIPPAELNEYLMEFILSVRQVDGKEYEPCSLRSMIGSFDRYLKEHDYCTTIARGLPFAQTMLVLSSKGKDLKTKGMGNKPKAAAAASDAEIDILFDQQQLGNKTPASLINQLWMNDTLHFDMRGGGAEHRQLMWGDINLCFDHELNLEYLEYNERQTKTRTGVDITNIRTQKPRMYATGTDRCPVQTYKCYADHRPADFSGPDYPFYLAAITNDTNPGPNQQWFLRGPIGKNKLNTLMKKMAQKADLPELQQGKRLTNTSIRKRLCQKLLQSNIPDTHAVHITGHKNADSLNNYRILSNNQQRSISDILAGTSVVDQPRAQQSSSGCTRGYGVPSVTHWAIPENIRTPPIEGYFFCPGGGGGGYFELNFCPGDLCPGGVLMPQSAYGRVTFFTWGGYFEPLSRGSVSSGVFLVPQSAYGRVTFCPGGYFELLSRGCFWCLNPPMEG